MTMHRAEIVESGIRSILHKLDFSAFDRKRLFITGGTGFFGFWLLAALDLLRNEGVDLQVKVLSRDPAKFLENHPRWRNLKWLHFVQGDVKSFDIPVFQFDYLIHAATDTSRAAHADSLSIFADIVDGSRRVLDYAVRCEVQRALFASSGAVYGPQPVGLDRIPDEAQIACFTNESSSAYGEGKRVMEFMAGAYAEKYQFKSVSARCFAFVGPGLALDQHFAIGNFIRDALYENQIRIKGDGRAVRSYLYGADLAIWLLKILIAGDSQSSYNVGSDHYLDTRQLAELIRDELAPGKEIIIEMNRSAELTPRSVYVPSIDKAKKYLDLDVWTQLPAAIRATANYWKSN